MLDDRLDKTPTDFSGRVWMLEPHHCRLTVPLDGRVDDGIWYPLRAGSNLRYQLGQTGIRIMPSGRRWRQQRSPYPYGRITHSGKLFVRQADAAWNAGRWQRFRGRFPLVYNHLVVALLLSPLFMSAATPADPVLPPPHTATIAPPPKRVLNLPREILPVTNGTTRDPANQETPVELREALERFLAGQLDAAQDAFESLTNKTAQTFAQPYLAEIWYTRAVQHHVSGDLTAAFSAVMQTLRRSPHHLRGQRLIENLVAKMERRFVEAYTLEAIDAEAARSLYRNIRNILAGASTHQQVQRLYRKVVTRMEQLR